MPACPSCGASTAPGPACAACGRPLPPPLAPPLLPLRVVGGATLAVGILIATAGLVLLGASGWFGDFPYFPLGIAAAGAAGIVAGSGLLARQPWAWGLAIGVAAFGLVYALSGLARGYSSGFVGLAVWGALAYGLSRQDVRAPLGQA